MVKLSNRLVMGKILSGIWNFYYDGFRNMGKTGRTLWLIIIIKLFIMFAILKVFFFKNDLAAYDTEEAKTEAVIKNLIN